MQSKDFVDRIDMIIDSIHSDKSQAFLGLKRLHAILKKNIEDIVVIYLENPDKFYALVKEVNALRSIDDPTIRALASEVAELLKLVSSSIEAPPSEREPIHREWLEKLLVIQSYLVSNEDIKVFKGIKMLSSLIKEHPGIIFELEVVDPELKNILLKLLYELSRDERGMLRAEANRLIQYFEKALAQEPPPAEEQPLTEDKNVVRDREMDAMMQVIDKLIEMRRETPPIQPATPSPQLANTPTITGILSKVTVYFMETKYLSALFIGEGLVLFGITAMFYTADIGPSSVNTLATIVLYCLIIGVVFKMLEDYLGEEGISSTYSKHSFVFNVAKIFLVINGLFFFFVALLV